MLEYQYYNITSITMPSYKFTYFNAPARGEVCRMLFNLAGVPFEDKRIEFQEWAAMKKDFPFGLPTLEIDGNGIFYGQSNAINRYIAKKYGFYGKTDLDQLKIDMLVDNIDDIIKPLFGGAVLATAEEKEALLKNWIEVHSPPKLAQMESILKENKGGDGWFVGDDISLADVHFLNWMEFPEFRYSHTMDLSEYPKLNELKKRVKSHPKIVEWIAKRPKFAIPPWQRK